MISNLKIIGLVSLTISFNSKMIISTTTKENTIRILEVEAEGEGEGILLGRVLRGIINIKEILVRLNTEGEEEET